MPQFERNIICVSTLSQLCNYEKRTDPFMGYQKNFVWAGPARVSIGSVDTFTHHLRCSHYTHALAGQTNEWATHHC
jgi:hypothetical protein